MKVAQVAFLMLGCLPLSAERVILLDTSGSMAGFANRASRMTGFVQRLGNLLQTSGPVATHAFASYGGKPSITPPLSINSLALRFSDPASFRGNSPLTWAIGEVMHRKPESLILLTDGMEDEARVGQLANALAGYAQSGWALGIAAFMLPFDGNYYAEMKIPFDDFRPQIEAAVHAANPKFQIAPAACTGSSSATCYKYTGTRPLLALLFVRGSSIEPVVSALKQAASEAVIDAPSFVLLSPASPSGLAVKPVMLPSSRELVRGPKTISGAEAELECIHSSSSPLDIQLVASAESAYAIPEASAPSALEVNIDSKPAWVRSVSKTLKRLPDGGASEDATIMCTAPSLLGSMGQSSTVLPGALAVTFSFKQVRRSEGWWIDLSAPNSWQYPHKVYHLRDVIERVESTVLANANPSSLHVSLKLRTRR